MDISWLCCRAHVVLHVELSTEDMVQLFCPRNKLVFNVYNDYIALYIAVSVLKSMNTSPTKAKNKI